MAVIQIRELGNGGGVSEKPEMLKVSILLHVFSKHLLFNIGQLPILLSEIWRV
jgi:hypothetical protein